MENGSAPASVNLSPLSATLKSPPLIDAAMVAIASASAFCSSGVSAAGCAEPDCPVAACSRKAACFRTSSWYVSAAAWYSASFHESYLASI